MKEVRPGIIMVRHTKKNKLEELKNGIIEEKEAIESEITEKYERGKEAVNELQTLSKSVTGYVEALRERGIDTDYIRDNAKQIRTIFFAVLELIENGHKGFNEKTKGAKEDGKKEKE